MSDSDDAPKAAATEIAERIEAARTRRIGTSAWEVLNHLRRNNWHATAADLAHNLRTCNYRGRISDLRDFGIQIKPDPPHPPPGAMSIYTVLPEYRPRAEYLLEHLSLEGFQDAPVQKGLFP